MKLRIAVVLGLIAMAMPVLAAPANSFWVKVGLCGSVLKLKSSRRRGLSP